MSDRTITLVATLGTNDLAYRMADGSWVSLGNNEADADGLGPLQQALIDLGYDSDRYLRNFRALTEHLRRDGYQVGQQLLASKLGRLISDYQSQLRQVILVATDQDPSVRFHTTDTIHAATLIQDWIQSLDPAIAVTVLPIQADPRNFDTLMGLWLRTFREQINLPSNGSLWLALQGGIAPMRESLRIAALNQFGDRAVSISFLENPQEQAQGLAARYESPRPANIYLFELIRRQAIALLENYDYSAAHALLSPYLKSDRSRTLRTYLKAGEDWNRARFSSCANQLQSLPGLGTEVQRRQEQFWQHSYESLHLARARFLQGNLVEAMIHSFRGLEDTLTQMISAHYPKYVKERNNQFPSIDPRITTALAKPDPRLRAEIDKPRINGDLELKGKILRYLACSHIPSLDQQPGFQAFWGNAMRIRNNQAHRIQGLNEYQFFDAWSTQHKPTRNLEDWDQLLTTSLNTLTGERFRNSQEGSLFARAHRQLLRELEAYQPLDDPR
ncbi:hypothetical protein VZG28_06375 [Synechococcus elongatus IITB4]|uniref:hypothetical protein n=1 Tax=Synechococcus elongatus TaxID=32046 RepID=UPI0030D393CC